MNDTTTELLTSLQGLQEALWHSITRAASDATATSLVFTMAGASAVTPGELEADWTQPGPVAHFALSLFAEGACSVKLSGPVFETSADIQAEDATPSLPRSALDAVIQGICLCLGASGEDAVAASGLSVRNGSEPLPAPLATADTLYRLDATVSSESLQGHAMWILDRETAQAILALGRAAVAAPASATADSDSDATSLELLMDIPLELSVELGRVKLPVKSVVDLGTGSIVEIDKAAGEPVDVLLNGRLVARGEVVVIDDNFGVRITEILSAQERGTRSEAA